MSNNKKKSVPLDIAAVAAALGVTSSAPAPTPKKAAAVAPKAANIQVKLCTGSVVTCVPKFMPTDVYVQTFDKVREVPVFRGKHVGFAAISDEIVAFVDRNDGKYDELPESLTDNLYKQFTLKKILDCKNQVLRDGVPIPLVPSSVLKKKQKQQRDFDRIKSLAETYWKMHASKEHGSFKHRLHKGKFSFLAELERKADPLAKHPTLGQWFNQIIIRLEPQPVKETKAEPEVGQKRSLAEAMSTLPLVSKSDDEDSDDDDESTDAVGKPSAAKVTKLESSESEAESEAEEDAESDDQNDQNDDESEAEEDAEEDGDEDSDDVAASFLAARPTPSKVAPQSKPAVNKVNASKPAAAGKSSTTVLSKQSLQMPLKSKAPAAGAAKKFRK